MFESGVLEVDLPTDPMDDVWRGLVMAFTEDAGQAPDADALAAWCASEPPSTEVVSVLSSLGHQPLSEAARIDVMVGWERVTAWAQSQSLQPLVDVVGVEPVSEHGPGTREHVTALLEQSSRTEDAQVALRLSGAVMHHRLLVARQLTTRLAATRMALSSGRITWWHALAIAEAAQPLDDVTAQRVEADVVAIATRSTLASTRRAIQRALARHDAAGAADRHEAGRAVSDVVSWPERDGLAVLQVRGTAAEIARLQGVVDAAASDAAADGADDGRLLGRRRVEALVRLLCDGSGSAKPRRAGLQVQLVVDLPTVVGLADHPAVIPGYGPIPAPIAREWAADAVSWRRLVVDPVSGSLLDYGQTRYRPPPGLAQFGRARDRFCRFPGCRRPAERCDLDHRVAFADGGATSSQSIQALCRAHHRLKTFTDWVSRRRPDGAVEWISPTGRRTVVDPHHQLHD